MRSKSNKEVMKHLNLWKRGRWILSMAVLGEAGCFPEPDVTNTLLRTREHTKEHQQEEEEEAEDHNSTSTREMKSLRKVRGFALHKHGSVLKHRRDLPTAAQLDELAHASKDLEDIRDSYDSLLSAAAATANSAYELSESVRDIGSCLLKRTALYDNEESGKVLLMLGKVQFEVQGLIDSYRTHIFKTITSPSESLLNELRIVEEMKLHCDEKRNIYEYMLMRCQEKGRSKSGKGESFSMEQVEVAQEEYDEAATLFVFRMKSLKQGQSRSLLTQAARHHAAQLRFFRKALECLESVEPHVKQVTEQQHVDYHFNGLEDEEEEADDDDEVDGGDEANDDENNDGAENGELSFDYRANDQEQAPVPTSMQLGQVGSTFPRFSTVEAAKENLSGTRRNSFTFRGEGRNGSQSEPLFAEYKEKFVHKQPSFTRRLSTYVLPTPVNAKTSEPSRLKKSLNEDAPNLRHPSSPEQINYEQASGNKKVSGFSESKGQPVLAERSNNSMLARLPRLADGFLSSKYVTASESDLEKIKLQAFSGPLISKPWAAKSLLVGHRHPVSAQHSAVSGSDPKKIKLQAFSGPLTDKLWSTKPVVAEHVRPFSGPISQNPVLQPRSSLSPKVSSSSFPTFSSSPKINELHELPRPPASSTLKSLPEYSGLAGHSGPLVYRRQLLTTTQRMLASKAASPLPEPPLVSRSFSTPSRSHRVVALPISKPVEAAENLEMAEDAALPPLTPVT